MKRYLFLIIILSLFLRIYRLPELMVFGGDVARDYLSARDITLKGVIPLVGCPSSVPWLHQGSFFIYVLGIVLWLGKYNPLVGGYFVGMLGVLGVLGVYLLGKKMFSQKAGLWATFFYSTSPLVVFFDRYPYHQSLISIFTIVFIFSIYLGLKNTKYFVLASFLFGLLMQLELSNLVLFPTLVVMIILLRRKTSLKVLLLSFLAFLSAWTPKIIYDLNNGFTQTIGFAAWIVHKILPISFLGDNPAETLPLVQRFLVIFKNISKIIFWPNISISAILFIILLAFLIKDNLKESLKEKHKGKLILLFLVGFSFLGFVIMGSPAQGYIPVIFPAIALMLGYFINSFSGKIGLFVQAAAFLLIVFNGYFLVKNNFLVDYSFKEYNRIADFIVKDAGGKKYNFVTLGDLAEFSSSRSTFDYLNWYKGNPPSLDKEQLKYLIFYNFDEQRYNSLKGEKKMFPHMTVLNKIFMISAVVLTKNEEKNIRECLSGLSWCDEVLVIDDNSTDKTREIAEECGAKIIGHSLDGNFAGQRNFGLEKAKGDWVFFVDADERVSRELEEEIKEKLKENRGIKGYYLRRVDNFMGKWLKHGEIGGVGGIGGIKILRLAKKGAGKWVRNVDEVWKIDGKTEILKNPLLHYPHPNLTQFLESVNERSTMNAEYLFEKNEKLNFFEWGKPFLKFIQNYFLKFGFLDGMSGFVFAVLMSLHSFLVRGKLYLLWRKSKRNPADGGASKTGKIVFLIWTLFVLGSYLYFLLQKGILRWSNWRF